MSMSQEDMIEEMTRVLQTGGDAQEDMIFAVIDGSEAQKEPLTESEIISIVTTELDNSLTSDDSTSTLQDNENALSYYLGQPRGDEIEGRSQATSTDVADAVEWILPQIIKALTAKGPVITFDAVAEDDEEQASLETEFTHDIFMKENEGFLNLYTFVKDALMNRNGIFKIYFDETDEQTQEQYTGLSDNELQMLSAQPEVEVVAMTQVVDEAAMLARQEQLNMAMTQTEQLMGQAQQAPDPQQGQAMMQKAQQQTAQLQQAMQQPPPMISDVTVTITDTKGCVVVECIPMEEFRVNKYHNSLNLKTARFTAHVTLKTRSELIEEGFDADIVNNAEANTGDDYERDYRFTEQDESSGGDRNYTEDRSQEELEVSECFMNIDLDRTGVASYQKITVLGSDDATDILSIEEVDGNPFISSSAIIMQHKFQGLSIYDRLKQLQDQKTSLWRNIMDNLYLQNNREKEVVEKNVNLDDLLVSRPGGIKRVKVPNSIRELDVQPIGQEGYQMLDYLDQIRTARVGVSPDTAAVEPQMGSAVGSEGVQRIMTAKEELTGLMVRAVAETGLKPAYMYIRDLLIKNQNSITKFKYKGQWADVNPTQWGERSRTTVQVGTGTGDDQKRVMSIQQVIAYQAQLVQDPRQTLIDMPQLYKALDTFCQSAGLDGADEYFLDPMSPEGQKKTKEAAQKAEQEKQKTDAVQQEMVKAQSMIGQAEQMKGQAALQSQQAKIQVEQMKGQQATDKQMFEAEKTQYQMQLDKMKTDLSAAKDAAKQGYDYDKLAVDAALAKDKLEQDEALKLTELEISHGEELSRQHAANKAQEMAAVAGQNTTGTTNDNNDAKDK